VSGKTRIPPGNWLALMVFLIIGLACAQTATAATHYFTPVRHQRGVLVFKLTGVQPSEIERAYVKAQGRRRALSTRRVRAAARHGVLRLRVRSSAPRHRSRGRHAHQASTTDPTLVVVTADTTTTTATGSTSVENSVSTFAPNADSYVTANKKKANYGTATELRVSGSPLTRSYLRFSVQGVANPVTRATLQLYLTSSSSTGFEVRSVADTSWSESRITYANAPKVGSAVTASGPFTTGTWLGLDITSLVKGTGVISVALTSASATAMAVASRETGVNSPQLVVETGAAPAPAPPPPSADSSPPTIPTGLSLTQATTTGIALAWSPSSDDVGVAGYGLYRDGALVGTTTLTSFTFSGLNCGTSYPLALDAFDAAGNRSAQASLGAATLGCSAGPRYPVRGIYDRDFSATGFDDLTAVGFNYIDTNPYKYQLDALVARGLKGFVWLGGYNDDPAVCNFNYDDAWVRNHIAGDATHPSIVGNPGVGAYFIDDEPNDTNCPNAPSQIKARSDLVKSLDPGKPTLMVHYKNFATWAGKTDILGLDHYPCSYKNGCDYSKIDAEAAEADRLGIRYWGVIQAYSDGASALCGSSPWYRLPTPDELHQEFVHWGATNMEGYLVFAWHYPDCDSSVWLSNHPELQAQLALENAS
jgi:hypothetical protein